MLKRLPEGVLFVLWHNRLFVGLEYYRRCRPKSHKLFGIVSASRDGAWLAAFFNDLGVQAIRGSSSRRGMQAARQAVGVLRDKNDLGITVDGPRGPRYQAQPGAALLALQTRAPLVLFSFEAKRAWRLKSWDGFIVPYPFSKLTVKLDYLPPYDSREGKQDRGEVLKQIQARLEAITPEIQQPGNDGALP